MKVEFYKHNIDQQDIDNVVKVLRSYMLTTGQWVYDFEDKLSRYLTRYKKYRINTVGVTSCTAALHLSLLAYDIGNGDEVITTPMTFIATPNSILHCGATPVFVDAEIETGNIDANLIENAITKKTKAIMPVHLYGQLADMKKIRRIADKYHLIVIEDSAHAVEAIRDSIKIGEYGDTACFSWYATKILSTGEGGAISTKDEEIADKLRKLRLHGMSKNAADRYTKRYEHWDMELLGWKYNMDNIQGALLIDQMNDIDKRWKRREEIARQYEESFRGKVNHHQIMPNSKSSRLMFTILVNPQKRDAILWQLQDKGIGVAVNFRAVHLLKYYRERFGYKRGMFPVAECIGDSTISLPLYPKLTDEEVDYVIKTVKEVVKANG